MLVHDCSVSRSSEAQTLAKVVTIIMAYLVLTNHTPSYASRLVELFGL